MSKQSNISSGPQKQDPLTDQQQQLFNIVVYVFLCQPVCLLGVVGNIINIVIFLKQGFAFTVNISFCGLAISDMCCLIFQIWFSVCINPLLEEADIQFDTFDIVHVTAGLPTVCFSRITSWITVYITAERCLGIALPLKVKQIVTAKRTVVIITIIYLANIAAFAPEYVNCYLGWKFYPDRNETLVGILFRDNSDESKTKVFVSMFLTGVLPMLAVILFTANLVYKLEAKSAWRQKATIENDHSQSMLNRDRKTVKMIVLIASIMIACYIPATILALVTVSEPDFTILGRYRNTFVAMWSFGVLAQDINSSVNIFLYYRMSTKYRHTFHDIFGKCVKYTDGLNN